MESSFRTLNFHSVSAIIFRFKNKPKTVNSKRFSITLVALIAIFQSVSAPVALALEPLSVQAYATDTVAGYPSSLRTSLISPNQDVRFVVEKPDGTVIQIPAQADMEGVAKADFFGFQTKQAGKYRVAVVYPGSAQSSPQTTFTVYPDQVSTTQSTLKSTLQMVGAGTDVTFVVVTLYDQYRNPIANHSVKLISSRSEDTIINLQNGVTDQNGRANFKVSSPNPGVSVFTAMDSTVNQILETREQVVFFQPTIASKPSFLSGLLRADIGGDGEPLAGPVDHFDIEGLPAQAKLGQELSLTITAKDQAGNVAKGYTGTILISAPDDENATLPSNGEYTFKDTDQGKFTFNLSLAFTKLGKQTVQVLDKANFKIAGEKSLEIIPKEGIAPGPASPTLVIKSPADGAQLGNSTVVLSGQGNPNINLKIFLDDTKIGDSQTDSDGFFTFEAKDLTSAAHTFYVMSDSGEVSKPVSVTIDTIPPVINSFTIIPEGNSLPGESLSVLVGSEPKLESAKVRVQGAEFDLKESSTEPGKYEATVTAPDAEGTYGVDVILVDSLGNKAELLSKGTIVVQKPVPVNPPKVEGLQAIPGDTTIQLSWTPVTSSDKPIQKYRISYGTNLATLDKTVDTTDSAPTWELRELTNDTQYFVNVKAVDSAGLESLEPSVTIAATPVAPLPTTPPVTETPTPVTTTPPIQAIPFDGAVSLNWIPFAGVQAYHYKVFIGTAPGQYSDSVITVDNATSVTVRDLINNLPYAFAVAALDINGNVISPLSQEVQAIPSGAGFHAAAPTPLPQDFGYVAGQPPAMVSNVPAPVQTGNLGRAPGTAQSGPEAIWVVLSSVVFAHFLYHHKKKVLKYK